LLAALAERMRVFAEAHGRFTTMLMSFVREIEVEGPISSERLQIFWQEWEALRCSIAAEEKEGLPALESFISCAVRDCPSEDTTIFVPYQSVTGASGYYVALAYLTDAVRILSDLMWANGIDPMSNRPVTFSGIRKFLEDDVWILTLGFKKMAQVLVCTADYADLAGQGIS